MKLIAVLVLLVVAAYFAGAEECSYSYNIGNVAVINKKSGQYCHKRVNTRSWMDSMSNNIIDTPMYKLKIPATHNSGTYNISGSSTVSVDVNYDSVLALIPVLQSTLAGYALSTTYVQSLLVPWMKNQECTILQQLRQGIRHLDIRLCSNKNSDPALRYQICHGYNSVYLTDVYSQIMEFVKSPDSANEIVSLDINHMYGFTTTSDLQGFLDITSQYLNNTLIDPALFNTSSTPRNIWETKQRIFLFVNNDLLIKYNGFTNRLFHSNNLTTYWANVQDTESLKQGLDSAVYSRGYNRKPQVLQGVLTADLNMIVRNTVYNLGATREVASNNLTMIGSWYDQYPQNLTNIINTDYYNLNLKGFVGKVIVQNKKYY